MGIVDNNAEKLPPQKLMATANEVAKNFKDLTKQLNNDLTLKERLDLSLKERSAKSALNNKSNPFPKMKKKPARNPLQARKNPSQNVSFTVEVDMSSNVQSESKKPVLSAKQKKVLTIDDLDEKQRKAEERRNVSIV